MKLSLFSLLLVAAVSATEGHVELLPKNDKSITELDQTESKNAQDLIKDLALGNSTAVINVSKMIYHPVNQTVVKTVKRGWGGLFGKIRSFIGLSPMGDRKDSRLQNVVNIQ